MFVVCLNGRVILPQPASCFASIGERAQWLRLAFLRTQWLRLIILRTQWFRLIWLVWYNMISVWSNCMLISECNGFCENKTVTNDELTNLSIKTLNTHNLSPYLDKFSKIKANSGQTVDRKLCQTSSRWPARPHYNWITWPEHYITSPVSYFVLNS